MSVYTGWPFGGTRNINPTSYEGASSASSCDFDVRLGGFRGLLTVFWFGVQEGLSGICGLGVLVITCRVPLGLRL